MKDNKIDQMFDTAAKQFNSSGKILDQDVIRLQKWLETQPHLPKMLDSHSLRNFLLLSKCNIETTKQKIDNYYTSRSKLPEIVHEMNPKLPYLKTFNDMAYFVDHPQLTNEMYKITFFKVKGEFISKQYEPMNAIRKYFTMQELKLRHDIMFGDILVFDCKGFTLNVVFKFTPTLLYKGLVLLYQRVYSMRCKAVHIINMPSSLSKVLYLIKCLVKPKLFERIHVHSEEDALKKVIPLNLLPVDFGGDGRSLQELENALQEKFLENEELFDSLDKIKVDESLRPKNRN